MGNTRSKRRKKARRIEALRGDANDSELEGKFVARWQFQQARPSRMVTNYADLFSCRMLPPSTTSDCPVMYEAAGDARKATAAATSSGVPARPIGVCSPAIRSDSVEDAVAIHPGATPLMVIPSTALSSATARIIPSIAAFAAP